MSPSVYIIILNWNGKELTLDCLKSLSKVQYDNYKILVVDNGSIDGSVKAIAKQYPKVEILPLESNLGYASGNNAGFEYIKKTNSNFIIFLNNDTIVAPNFIEPLVKSLNVDSAIGQTVPKIYYANHINKIWYAGGKVNLWIGAVFHEGIRKSDAELYQQSKITDYATGCCFCMRTADYAELGGFDTSFPMYGEDVDLSLRIGETGKKVMFVPESNIWHKVSASVGGELSTSKFKRKIRGLVKVFNKHTNILQKVTIGISWTVSIPYFLIKFIYLKIKK